MPTLISRIFKVFFAILVTLVLILGSVRLLATDTYLAFEYGKASFPPDSYGFTQQERFDLASTNLHYVLAHLPGDTLSNETLNGVSVYTEREAAHMVDVRSAFQSVMRLWQAAFILLLVVGFFLWKKEGREALALAIQWGGIMTGALILSIALLAALAWQVWFDNFHLIFFEPGSWLFAYSDTLIRLFPLPFWTDATFTITAFSLATGLLLIFAGWRWQFILERTRPARIL